MDDNTPTPAEQTPAVPVQPAVPPAQEPPAAPEQTPAPTQEPPAQTPPAQDPPAPAYEPVNTGVPFYDNTAKVLADAGLDPRALIKQIEDNDGVITDDIRAAMSEKLGEANTYLIEQGFTNQRAAEARERGKVFDAIGGEEVWNTLNEWTRSDTFSMDKEAVAELNTMLAKGGESAIAAAKKLKEAYMADPQNNIPAQQMMSGDATPPAAPQVTPISRAQYVAEKQKAVRENNAALVAELEKRATFTMNSKPELWRPVAGRY